MKKTSLFISTIFGLMLVVGFAYADLDIYMTPNPVQVPVGTTGHAIVTVVSTNPVGYHNVYLDGFICKDTNNDLHCEAFLLNTANSEINVTFDNGLASTTTNSTDEAMLNIKVSADAPTSASYRFKVNTDDGNWQEAVVTGETDSTAIPEFPSSVIPAALSFASFAIVSRKFK